MDNDSISNVFLVIYCLKHKWPLLSAQFPCSCKTDHTHWLYFDLFHFPDKLHESASYPIPNSPQGQGFDPRSTCSRWEMPQNRYPPKSSHPLCSTKPVQFSFQYHPSAHSIQAFLKQGENPLPDSRLAFVIAVYAPCPICSFFTSSNGRPEIFAISSNAYFPACSILSTVIRFSP